MVKINWILKNLAHFFNLLKGKGNTREACRIGPAILLGLERERERKRPWSPTELGLKACNWNLPFFFSMSGCCQEQEAQGTVPVPTQKPLWREQEMSACSQLLLRLQIKAHPPPPPPNFNIMDLQCRQSSNHVRKLRKPTNVARFPLLIRFFNPWEPKMSPHML